MGLEAATFINQLDATNPVGAVDPKSQGDDHLRLIKSALQATFTGLTGAMDRTQAQLNLVGSDGTVALPAITFSSDLDTGFYRIAANRFGLSLGGVKLIDFGTANSPIIVNAGSSSANNALQINNAADTLTLFAVRGDGQIETQDGSVGTPVYAWVSDPDTGMYRSGNNTIGFGGGGVFGFAVDGGHAYCANGTAALPSLTFNSDNDTGIYRDTANRISFATAGVARGYIEAGAAGFFTPLLFATGIHNGTAPTGAADQFIASGTYTPTASGSFNIDAVTPQVAQWMRVGNVVTVSGTVTVDATAASLTGFELSLPIASNIAGTNQLVGSAIHASGPPFVSVQLIGSVANNTATFTWTAAGTSSLPLYYHYTYLVV